MDTGCWNVSFSQIFSAFVDEVLVMLHPDHYTLFTEAKNQLVFFIVIQISLLRFVGYMTENTVKEKL